MNNNQAETQRPSNALIAQKEMLIYGIIHFGLNTFSDMEWGMGSTSPSLFNPLKFDAGKIARAAKAGGLQGLILVCKHHDGFCLWPTKTTSYNISASPWKNGKGDMVKDFSDACHAESMKFGVYISPWDRNAACYGKPEYPDMFREQIREVLTNYGPVFEMWFDGANGGNGYYGGANETRKIDASLYYDWEKTWRLVRELQPEAAIFSDVGPERRWAGTETGYIDMDCFSSIDPRPNANSGNSTPCPGNADNRCLYTGTPGGKFFRMPECDFPLRPRWFYHKDDDGHAKSPAKLLDIYLRSVGCGGTMNVGIAPDQQGEITEEDVASLQGFREKCLQLFEHPVHSGSLAGSGEMTLNRVRTFNFARISEPFEAGNRIAGYRLEAMADGKWSMLASGKAIGSCRLRHFKAVAASRIRLCTESVDGVMAEARIELYNAPWQLFDESPVDAVPSGWERVDALPLNRMQVLLELGSVKTVSAILFVPQDDAPDGTPDRFSLEISLDGMNWSCVIPEGEFSNIKANPIPQTIRLPDASQMRCIRFTTLHFQQEKSTMTVYKGWGVRHGKN